MAKLTYKPKPNVVVEFDAADQKDIVEKLAELYEIFEHSCGKCKAGKEKIIFVVREVDGNKFYESRCTACGATLGFGSHKKGNTLFPQRKDADGQQLPDFGWTKWNPETKTRE